MVNGLFIKLDCVSGFMKRIFSRPYLMFGLNLSHRKCLLNRRNMIESIQTISIEIDFGLNVLNQLVTILIIFVQFKLMTTLVTDQFSRIGFNLQITILGFSHIQ